MNDSDDDEVFSDDIEIDELLNQRSNASSDRRHEETMQTISTTNTHHRIDYENLKTYIYPINYEMRDYQFNIVRKAFYQNLLVALPTGLGKTFIASTVMLNFWRWFPEAKIIFMAPTRPLVAQQLKACCGTVGIHASNVAILLDKTRKDRRDIWNSKSVFFTTPQVVENDLVSGIVDPKSVVLLVVDEAHRSKGNYAYNNIVKFLSRFNQSFRILGLTATPAADVEGVQEIITNLKISKIEVRTENSIDIVSYIKRKKIKRITAPISDDISICIDGLSTAIAPALKIANERKIFDLTDPSKINHFQCMEASQRIIKNPSLPEGLKWSNYFLLQLLGTVGQCYRRLNIYGLRSFYTYFKEKQDEFITKYEMKKSTNKLNASFYRHESIIKLMKFCEERLSDINRASHPKTEILLKELTEFFSQTDVSDSRVIIFTEFRDSALEIVQSIENLRSNLKPHIFIGQAKERERFEETKYREKVSKKKKTPAKKNEKKDNNPRNSSRSSSETVQLKGMNQKLQKEIMQKFKSNEYNILVATSIGEEGLDIGEVDLIVCYDSTSSPIKNIQRMGRTGRKRDGKIILLFSSNEESKFDKAMGGYDYIQKAIMKGDQIELHDSPRIIPQPFNPIVEKTFIEIPEENLDIKREEDEDEILRIAVRYMTSGKIKGKRKTKNKDQKDIKRFFMPDNVDTGFKSAATLIDKISNSENSEILDSLLESDPESGSNDEKRITNHTKKGFELSEYLHASNNNSTILTPPESKSHNDYREQATSSVSMALSSRRGITPSSDDPIFDSNKDEKDSESDSPNSRAGTMGNGNKPKSLGVKRRRTNCVILGKIKEKDSERHAPHEDLIIIDDDFDDFPYYPGVDGVEARSPALDPLQQSTQTNVKENQVQPQVVKLSRKPHNDTSGDLLSNAKETITEVDEGVDEDDIFDDGLDRQLLQIEKSCSFNENGASNTATDISDPLFDLDFTSTEGHLSEDELMELYTKYYITLPPEMKNRIHIPSIESAKSSSLHKVRYSKKTRILFHLANVSRAGSSIAASELCSTYKNLSAQSVPSVEECLQFLDSIIEM